MKEIIVGTLIFLILCLSAYNSWASWLIDEERYHVSAHGKNSCQDCHADITDKFVHPDPNDVNKTLRELYRLEQCTSCHLNILEDLKRGTHGGESIADEKEFNFCIGCHDPHYQLLKQDSATNLDLAQPIEKKCSLCHDLQESLPEFSYKDEQCMHCHRSTGPEDPEESSHISNLCFHCHAKDSAAQDSTGLVRINVAAYSTNVHADISCTICHIHALEFQHKNQLLGDCRQCHLPHDEKIAHDAHIRVSCGACHLNNVSPVKDSGSGQIQWQINRGPDEISNVHSLTRDNHDKFCRRCHFNGNTVGAVTMLLPAKSVICMPCHASTISAGDAISLAALIVFGLGILSIGSIWITGSRAEIPDTGTGNKFFRMIQSIRSAIFSGRIFSVIKILILDGIFQRRLYRISRSRWLMHALIFFPFLFRFCWGLVALVASIGLPSWQGTWIMLDKNHPLPAFLFDLTGVLFLFGVALIFFRKYVLGFGDKLKGLPRADWLAYSLIGGIMIIGFVVEAMRIAMTGTPDGSQYAFIGFAISRLFAGVDLTGFYGYIWYLHAIFTGAFLAYLPFSRMFHIFMAPVSLAINTSAKNKVK
jgi:nitrate reductase gamma subunit